MLHVISVSLLLDPPSKFPLKSPPPLSLPQHPQPPPPPYPGLLKKWLGFLKNFLGQQP